MMTKIWRVIVTILVIFSLALNVFLLMVLARARHGLVNTIDIVRNTLETMSEDAFVITVEIDQDIPINTAIPISQTVTIPINIDYPLSTIVNTSFTIPVIGRQEVSFPIQTVIPVHMDFEIPIQEVVHISMTYPLQIELPVEVDIPNEVESLLDQRLMEIGANFK